MGWWDESSLHMSADESLGSMEKDTENEEIVPSEDLILATEEQLELLEAVDNHQELYEGPALSEAVRRYLVCWLPLVAKSDIDDVLLPPLDIQWVWYCHALDPLQYNEDVKEVIGSTITHSWIRRSKRKHATEKAAKHWSDHCEDEPFHLQMHSRDEKMIPDNLANLSKKIECCVRQEKHFYYQVSLPHYQKDACIQIALERYQKFLKSLRKRPSNTPEILTDVELLWRSHILHTDSYTRDCKQWFGQVLEHPAGDGYQGPPKQNGSPIKIKIEDADGKLPASRQLSKVCHFFRRGESPIGRLINLPEEEKADMSAKVCEISIEEILIEGYRIDDKGTRISTSVELAGKREKHHVSKGLIEFSGTHYNPEEKKPINFSVDPQRYDTLILTLTKKSGSKLKGNKTTKGSHIFDLIPLIETCPKTGTTFSESGSFNVKDLTVHISVRGTIKPTDRGTITLTQVPGVPDAVLHSSEAELLKIFKRIGLTQKEIDHIGEVVLCKQRFINRSSRLIFTCHHYQKLPYLSLVQVMSKGQPLAEGNIISPTSLPHQSFTGIPCLEEGDIGFVVKNSSGDWGIVVARTSARPAGTRRLFQHEVLVTLYTIAPVSKLWTTVTFHLPDKEGKYQVEGSGFRIDLKTGIVTIFKSCPDVAETVTLAYGLSTLYALTWASDQNATKATSKKSVVRFSGEQNWSEVSKCARMLSSIKVITSI